MSQTQITLTDLTKRFDDVTAVDGIDLSVREGEFLVLVGPSGCGKSTTLRLLAGLEDATSGRVEIGGTDVTDVEPSDRNVAMVFQNYALYPHMSAERNMTFGAATATEFDETEIEERAGNAAEILDIEGLLDRKPDALSGGEQQRVAIGRALVRDPAVFLMDEPLSNLDAKLRVQMRAELSQLHADLGTTMIYVTHDQVEAMTLGDRVAVMNDGHVEQVASPQALYDYPATRFVAEFVGSPGMNAVPAELGSEGREAHWADAAVSLPRDAVLEDAAGDRVVFGVRPEDLALDDDGPITVDVTVVEPLGDALLVRGTAGDHVLEVRLGARAGVEPGDRITLGVDPERLHLFDVETGEAIYHSARATASDANASDSDAATAAADGGRSGVDDVQTRTDDTTTNR